MASNREDERRKPEIPILIKAWRTFRQMTQEELAAAMTAAGLNITPSYLAAVERGDRRWNVSILWSAAVALNCSPADLIETNPNLLRELITRWERIPPENRALALRLLEPLETPRRAGQPNG